MSYKRPWKLFMSIAIVTALALTSACASQQAPEPAPTQPPTEAPAGPAKPSGKVVIGMPTLGSGFIDPMQLRTGMEAVFGKAMFESLVIRDDAGKLAPQLATSWEIGNGGKTITFTLRKGVKFHDGSELAADDVKWSVERALGPDVTSVLKATLQGMIGSVEVADSSTVRFNMKTTDPTFFDIFHLLVPILPKEAYEGKPASAVNDQPIGTGPWKYVSRNGNDSVFMTAFEDHWAQAPSVKDLELRVIPDPATQWAALRSGEIDLAYLTGSPLIAEAINDPTMKLFKGKGAGVVTVNPNVQFIKSAADMTDLDQPFLDARVRQAMSLALDRKQIAETLYLGNASPAKYTLLPTSRGYRASDPDPGYDPARARQLLAEAGYPSGFRTELHYTEVGLPAGLVELMQAAWKAIGVDVKLVKASDPDWIMKLLAGKYPGMVLNIIPAPSMFEPGPGQASLYAGAINPPYDRISAVIGKWSNTLDEAGMNAAAEELRKIYLEEMPDLAVVYLDAVWVGGPRVDAWPIPPAPSVNPMNTHLIKLKGQ